MGKDFGGSPTGTSCMFNYIAINDQYDGQYYKIGVIKSTFV
jgi:hypothetical protein